MGRPTLEFGTVKQKVSIARQVRLEGGQWGNQAKPCSCWTLICVRKGAGRVVRHGRNRGEAVRGCVDSGEMFELNVSDVEQLRGTAWPLLWKGRMGEKGYTDSILGLELGS